MVQAHSAFLICHLSAIGYLLLAMRFADCTGVSVRTGKFQLAQIEKSEISPDAILTRWPAFRVC